MLNRRLVGLGLVVGLAGPGGASGQPPTLVSPGSVGGAPMVESRCPTFSWAPEGVAEAFEVRVFNAALDAGAPGDPEEAEISAARPILRARVPGTASSWTPALPHCLEQGARYLWTVSAVDGGVVAREPATAYRFAVVEPALPRPIARELLQTIDRLLLEGGLAPESAAALLRVLGWAAAEPQAVVEPALLAPIEEVAGAAARQAVAGAPAVNRHGLSATLENPCAGCVAAAIQGVASIDIPTVQLFASPIGVLGESSCGALHDCSGGAGVYGVGDRVAGVRAEGMGKGRIGAALRVNNSQHTQGIAAYLTNASGFATAHLANAGSGQILYLQNGGNAAGAGGGNFIEARNVDETDIQFRVASDGTAYSDTSFNGGGADFAEMMAAAEELAPGEVLIAGADGRVERARRARDTAVIGVYSTAPGFIGGAGPNQDLAGKVPVAIVGIVPVFASAESGPIAPGDLLVSASLAGHAMRAAEPIPAGAVLGKALSGLEGGRGVIQVLLAAR